MEGPKKREMRIEQREMEDAESGFDVMYLNAVLVSQGPQVDVYSR